MSSRLRTGRAPGFWAHRRGWAIRSVDDAMRARDDISATVAAREQPTEEPRPFFASAAARAETAAGELLLNGLDHGEGPVTATLSRGQESWLLEVTDGAVQHPPTVGEADLSEPGGLGLTLTLRISDAVGWYTDDQSKTVWSEVGNVAPSHLMESLSHQNG